MIRLYSWPTSVNSYKIRLLLSILRIEHEIVPTEIEGGRNKIDWEYLKLNPRGQIPTLDDGGFVLWGSTAILFHLASRYDSGRVWLPFDARTAAEITQWLDFAQNECTTGLSLARAIQQFRSAGDLLKARRDGEKALAVLEGRLAQRDWLVGEHGTIADIACFPHTALAGEGGFNLTRRPAIQRWIERISRVDGFVGMPGFPP